MRRGPGWDGARCCCDMAWRMSSLCLPACLPPPRRAEVEAQKAFPREWGFLAVKDDDGRKEEVGDAAALVVRRVRREGGLPGGVPACIKAGQGRTLRAHTRPQR